MIKYKSCCSCANYTGLMCECCLQGTSASHKELALTLFSSLAESIGEACRREACMHACMQGVGSGIWQLNGCTDSKAPQGTPSAWRVMRCAGYREWRVRSASLLPELATGHQQTAAIVQDLRLYGRDQQHALLTYMQGSSLPLACPPSSPSSLLP